MGLLNAANRSVTSVRSDLRHLDRRIGQAGLTYRAVAIGQCDPVTQLKYVESDLVEDCKMLAQAIAAKGGERRLMKLLHQRRKLASLLASGNFDLLRRYVSFINSIINSVRNTAVDI